MSGPLSAALDRLDAGAMGELASVQRMAPWVVAALDGAGRSEAATSTGLRATATWQAIRGLQLEHELRAVLAEFGAAGVPSIVLKGPVIASRYYPRADLRPYGDLDLLIREDGEQRAHDILIARGYVLAGGGEADPLHHDHAKFQTIYKRTDGLIVEIHHDHLQIGLRPLSLDEVWDRAVPTAWGADARMLEDNDQFVLLAVHLQRHNFDRLLWFKDLDLMVRGGVLDWQRIAAIADLEGCSAAVGYALSLLVDMLGTPLPADAQALIARRGWFARIVQSRLWPRSHVLAFEHQRRWRWRRATQFAPETGLIRGSLPSLLTWGRRGSKARVFLAAAMHRDREAS
ncbi:MAG: nucleotidyltransferase family protein [Dehalococcoidia bacterium]